MQAIAINQNDNGEFQIEYKNGLLKREESEIAYAKHNLLCFGRLSKHLTINQTIRRGSVGSVLEGRQLYSTAWLFYSEAIVSESNVRSIILSFNSACDRDFKAGLIDKRISLKTVTKLDKYTLRFTIIVDSQEKQFEINLK